MTKLSVSFDEYNTIHGGLTKVTTSISRKGDVAVSTLQTLNGTIELKYAEHTEVQFNAGGVGDVVMLKEVDFDGKNVHCSMGSVSDYDTYHYSQDLEYALRTHKEAVTAYINKQHRDLTNAIDKAYNN